MQHANDNDNSDGVIDIVGSPMVRIITNRIENVAIGGPEQLCSPCHGRHLSDVRSTLSSVAKSPSAIAFYLIRTLFDAQRGGALTTSKMIDTLAESHRKMASLQPLGTAVDLTFPHTRRQTSAISRCSLLPTPTYVTPTRLPKPTQRTLCPRRC